MKLFIAAVLLTIYLYFAPDYFIEILDQMYQLEEMTVRVLKFTIMVSGAITFGALIPTRWLRTSKNSN